MSVWSLTRKVERARRAPAAHLDVVVGRLADRRRSDASGSAGSAGSRAARACTRSSSPSRRLVSSPMPATSAMQRRGVLALAFGRADLPSTARCASPAGPACGSGCPCARASSDSKRAASSVTPRLASPAATAGEIVAKEIDVEHARILADAARSARRPFAPLLIPRAQARRASRGSSPRARDRSARTTTRPACCRESSARPRRTRPPRRARSGSPCRSPGPS